MPASPGRGATTQVIPHRSLLRPDDVTQIHGVPTTSAARTLYDLARSADIGLSVAMADVALSRRLVTSTELKSMVESNVNRPGVRRARQILGFADGRSESVGESITRVRLRQLGLPVPELQGAIVGSQGELVARVDFLFADFGTALEFDGKLKYEKLLRVGESAADVVYREKVREDKIRALGFDVVRLVWRDHRDPQGVLARCRAAFERQGHQAWDQDPPGLIDWRPTLR